MGDFQRNSSRFNRGGGNSGGGDSAPQGRASGGNGGGGGFQRRGGGNSGGNSGGGYQGRGQSQGQSNGGGQQQGEFPFSRIASITIPKSAGNDVKDFVDNELKNSNLTLNAKIYLGKGDNELTLRNGDTLLIQFKNGDKDKDFVVGRVSVKN